MYYTYISITYWVIHICIKYMYIYYILGPFDKGIRLFRRRYLTTTLSRSIITSAVYVFVYIFTSDTGLFDKGVCLFCRTLLTATLSESIMTSAVYKYVYIYTSDTGLSGKGIGLFCRTLPLLPHTFDCTFEHMHHHVKYIHVCGYVYIYQILRAFQVTELAALLTEYWALLTEYWALLTEYWALLMRYRALFIQSGGKRLISNGFTR